MMSLFTAKYPKKIMGDSFCEIIDGSHSVYKVLEQTETNGVFGSEIHSRKIIFRIFSKKKSMNKMVENILSLIQNGVCKTYCIDIQVGVEFGVVDHTDYFPVSLACAIREFLL